MEDFVKKCVDTGKIYHFSFILHNRNKFVTSVHIVILFAYNFFVVLDKFYNYKHIDRRNVNPYPKFSLIMEKIAKYSDKTEEFARSVSNTCSNQGRFN